MKRSGLLIGGVIVLVLILAAGAFTAVRLLTPQAAARGDYGPGVTVYEDVFADGDGNPVTVTTVIEPSPDLPDRPSEASGVFVRQEDSIYFVGTGSISVNVTINNGERSVATDHSGPEVEVVTNRDTIFYEDVTKIDYEATESVERHYVQELRQVERPAEMPGGASMAVWGEKRGDRVVAEIVVFGESE